MQQAAQPSQADFRLAPAFAAGDPLTQGGDPLGVRNLQADFGVGGVVGPDIVGKSTQGARTVDGHGEPS